LKVCDHNVTANTERRDKIGDKIGTVPSPVSSGAQMEFTDGALYPPVHRWSLQMGFCSMDLKSLTDHEVKALLPHVFKHSVAILRYHSKNNCSVGSGTLVNIGTRFFVATAAHNLVDFSDECLILGHTKEVSYKQLQFERRRPFQNEPEPTTDVGYIELSGATAASMPEKDFLPLEMIRPFVNSWPTRVFLAGFPSELVPKELVMRNEFRLRGLGYLTETRNLKAAQYEDVDESRDIHVDYDKRAVFVQNQSVVSMPEPYGISGGGLWGLPTMGQGMLWTPENAMLIGIDRSWMKHSRVAFCTQIQHWLRLVASDYPDLIPLIDDHLHRYARNKGHEA